MTETTVYGELWHKVIAKPRYDQRLADQLRRAHNRIIFGEQKPVDIPVSFAEEVTKLSQGKATAKRIIIEPESGFYNGELRS